MIELQMVHRMMRRGAVLAGPAVLALGLWGGVSYALSGAAGIGMALLNLWLAGRIIGGVADKNPQLLLPAGMATFVFGLVVLTLLAWALQAFDIVSFPVTGITLVTAHLGLVLWEASGKHSDPSTSGNRAGLSAARSRS